MRRKAHERQHLFRICLDKNASSFFYVSLVVFGGLFYWCECLVLTALQAVFTEFWLLEFPGDHTEQVPHPSIRTERTGLYIISSPSRKQKKGVQRRAR